MPAVDRIIRSRTIPVQGSTFRSCKNKLKLDTRSLNLRRLDLRKAQAARLNTIRDINRQIVLNYVREREPISRAEIARETALQRSTISAIVEDLKSEGLVEEVGEGESTGGRRPTLLKLRAAGPIALGVSITPTCTTIATSDLAGRVIDQEEFLTDADKTINQVIEIVSDFTARYKGIDRRCRRESSGPRRSINRKRALHSLLPLARSSDLRNDLERGRLAGRDRQRRQRRRACRALVWPARSQRRKRFHTRPGRGRRRHRDHF